MFSFAAFIDQDDFLVFMKLEAYKNLSIFIMHPGAVAIEQSCFLKFTFPPQIPSLLKPMA